MSRSRHLVALVLLSFFILPVIWALFHPGFFVSDDGEWMIIRLTDFHRSLADGQFPVRWLARLNHEYGYPVINFLYPGFLYLGEVLHLLGFNFVNSIKIIFGLSFIFSGVFSYLWLTRIFGRFSAFIGAIFYVYAPYHLYDVYTRGSVGEALALAIVPFCLWMAEKKNLPLLGLGYGLLIISHNTLALLFTPVLVAYILSTHKSFLHAICHTLYAISLGLGLSSFFWIPAIFDLKYTVFRQTLVVDWHSAFFTVGYFRLMDWPSVLVFFLCFFLLKKQDKKVLIFWLLFPISFLLTLPLSKFIWEILPLNQIIQFSFRFLFLTILAGSFLTAFLLSRCFYRLKVVMGVFLLGLLFTFSFPFIQPGKFFDKGEGFYTTNEGTTTVRDEYMTRWARIFPTERPKQKIEIIAGKAEIKDQFVNSRKITFRIEAGEESLVRINTLYFPGWQAQVDKQSVEINYENEKGVIQIPVNQGDHEVMVKFGETPLRLFSDIISLLSFLFLAGLLIRSHFLKR
ncbi:MAG: 6-pyruvoyl-tetrahydropterin synthase-related protein [bacterium]|nr:6-pyruvoyl-tetrahydropterin synthase-related protein [bacterium]